MAMATATVERQIQVKVEPRGAVIAATPGMLLLDLLMRAGMPVSYSCQAGRCGTCRCELLAGDVLEDADCEFRGGPLPGATRQVLACRTRLVGDCVIGLVEPDEVVVHPAQVLKCRVEAVERLNEAIVALRLRPNRRLRFSAGQFAKLDFGAGLVRPYSMANVEGDEILEFQLRLVPGGRVSGFVAGQVRSGHVVKLTGPLGTSYLRRQHTGPMLCVAGGTGLAPISSIVRTALSGDMPGPIRLYVGARSEAELYGIDDMRALESRYPSRLRVDVAVDARPRVSSVRQGLITDAVASDMASLSQWKVYLAGPPPMVEAGSRLAIRLGAIEANVYADAFYPSES
jgi:ferredoxin-NAD(P)+ reductase (naphthalene dioxygenase ferredoxin-specific)